MGDFERPQSRLAFVSIKNTDLKVDLEKLSLLNDGDSSKINSMILDNENNNMEAACGPPEPLDEKVGIIVRVRIINTLQQYYNKTAGIKSNH